MEQKIHGVMEMEMIKVSKRGKERLMRGCFLFLGTLSLSSSFLSFSLFPRADLSLACPDGLESVPGKTGHPSPPLHLTPPPSPL